MGNFEGKKFVHLTTDKFDNDVPPRSLSRSVYQFTIPSSGRRLAEYQSVKLAKNAARVLGSLDQSAIRIHDKRRGNLFIRATPGETRLQEGLT